MEALAMIQLAIVLAPYLVKFLENVENMEEVQELVKILKKVLDSGDLPKILDLIRKLT